MVVVVTYKFNIIHVSHINVIMEAIKKNNYKTLDIVQTGEGGSAAQGGSKILI